MSKRIVTLLARTVSGDFIDPITGTRLMNVADGNNIQPLVDKFKTLRVGNGVLKVKKDEVQMSELYLLASHTGGGELKAPVKFKAQ